MVRIVDPIGEGRIEGPVVQLEVAVEAPEVGHSEVPDRTKSTFGFHGAATKVHSTEKFWIKNPDGPRSLEDAVLFADSRGSFFEGIVDLKVVGKNQVLVDAGSGLKVKFVSVNDKEFTNFFGKEPYAVYSPSKRVDESLFDPNAPMSFKELFGDIPTVRVRQSVLESDRGMAAVLGHEFFEIRGLYQKLQNATIPYSKVQGLIDDLHNGAVSFGDNLVRQMLKEGL